jgi:hypothetical protein
MSSEKPIINFFFAPNLISFYPPDGGHRTMKRPSNVQELEHIVRNLLANEKLTPEELESEVQRLKSAGTELWKLESDPNWKPEWPPNVLSRLWPDR